MSHRQVSKQPGTLTSSLRAAIGTAPLSEQALVLVRLSDDALLYVFTAILFGGIKSPATSLGTHDQLLVDTNG